MSLPPGVECHVLESTGLTRRQIDWLAEKGIYKKIVIDRSFLALKPRPKRIRLHTGNFVDLLQPDTMKADKGIRGYRTSYITLYIPMV